MWAPGAGLRAHGALILAAAAMICAVQRGHAQSPVDSARKTRALSAISGTVRDSAGNALSGVSLQIAETTTEAKAGADGRFFFPALTSGEVRIIARFLGYLPQAVDVRLSGGDTVVVDLELEKAPQTLAAVVVKERPLVPDEYRFTMRFDDFFRHRATAPNGKFFDREALAHYGGPARALSTLPGVKAKENMGNLNVQFARCSPTTSPALILNGVLTDFSALLTIPVTSIELIEVYRSVSEMPIEARGSSCGALVIYTK